MFAVCLTGEEDQIQNSTTGGCLGNLRKPHGLSKKQYSTPEEGQSVICGLCETVYGAFSASQPQ